MVIKQGVKLTIDSVLVSYSPVSMSAVYRIMGSRQPVTAQSAVVGTEPRLSRLYRANDETDAREDKMQGRRDQEVPMRISDSDALRCPSSISTAGFSVNVQERHPDGAPSSTNWLMRVTRRPIVGSSKGESKSFQAHISRPIVATRCSRRPWTTQAASKISD